MKTIKEFQQASIENSKAALFLKSVVRWIYKKMEKASNKGNFSVHLALNFFTQPKDISTEELTIIIGKYFADCGYQVEANRIHREMTISWRPKDFICKIQICDADDRLKHLISTGATPQVLITEEDKRGLP